MNTKLFLLALFPVIVRLSFTLQKHLGRHAFCHGVIYFFHRGNLRVRNDSFDESSLKLTGKSRNFVLIMNAYALKSFHIY
ncbi:CLUMA_CG019356, isoform A [Clunio marinus]|uniref:CLUMA_CG019356, isoform A n=1 Tax=Clunio marinus TaxID=568069 RepID=A0A1J1J1M5_9DIPT|nr:CLUMA_CG019356, isoform A [Clunio marinus]